MLTGVSGFYLPVLEEGSILDCPDLPDAALEATIRQGTYPFSTFQFCAPTGSGIYEPAPADTVELAQSSWVWEDGTGQIEARKLRVAYLILDPSSYTEELIDSDRALAEDVELLRRMLQN